MKCIVSNIFSILVFFSEIQCAAQENRQIHVPQLGANLKSCETVFARKLSVLPTSWQGSPVTSYTHLKEIGLYLYFNKENILEGIKAENPFKGQINGVKLGEVRKSDLIAALGKPKNETKEDTPDFQELFELKAHLEQELESFPDPVPKALVKKHIKKMQAIGHTKTQTLYFDVSPLQTLNITYNPTLEVVRGIAQFRK